MKGAPELKTDSGKTVIPASVKKALVGEAKAGGMDAERMLAAALESWGGPEALMADLRLEFKAAPAGGIARQRILDMIQRLVMYCTERNLTRVKKPEDMTTEELEAVLAHYIRRQTQNASQEED